MFGDFVYAVLVEEPRPAVLAELAERLSADESQARTDLSTIRDWLGKTPRTGDLILQRSDLNTPDDVIDNGGDIRAHFGRTLIHNGPQTTAATNTG